MEHGTPLHQFRYPQGKSFGKTTVVERIKPYNICSYNIEDNNPSLILHAHTYNDHLILKFFISALHQRECSNLDFRTCPISLLSYIISIKYDC